MAYMKVHVQGTPIQQWNWVRECKTRFFKKKCHDQNYPRGFTTDELMEIQNGFLNFGYNELNQEINI